MALEVFVSGKAIPGYDALSSWVYVVGAVSVAQDVEAV